MWKTLQTRANLQYQGKDTSVNSNASKLRSGSDVADATAVEDKAIGDTYGNRFCLPLDFERFETLAPYYQSALGDRLEHEYI